MDISRTREETPKAPEEWFTGDVWMDAISEPLPAPSRIRALSVHFTPGARTAWHTHPLGQILHVTEGVGRVQSEGGPVREIKAGDTVRLEAGENHWHGAAPATFMTHIALQEVDDEGVPAHWGEKVSDDDYLAEPAAD